MATPVAVPLAVPTRIATREVLAREFVLVEVTTDDGVVGVGYTYTGTTGGELCAGFINDYFAPRLVGESALAPERIWAALFQEHLLIGRRGFLLRALSALDIALWDVVGKVAGQPLYRLLGGFRDSVPAYASGGYYRAGDPLENIEKEFARYLGMGFSDFKIKVGGAPLDVDVERVRVAREMIGPRARLGLDANNAWRTPAEALRFARAVEKYDPWWLEEPLLPDDVEGHAQIAAALDWPVATGRDPRLALGLPRADREARRRHPPAGCRGARAASANGCGWRTPRRRSTSRWRRTGTPTSTSISSRRSRTR